MTALQTRASQQFITAMGSMVENPSNLPMITMDELEQNGMPLHTAMDKLRAKARAFYQV